MEKFSRKGLLLRGNNILLLLWLMNVLLLASITARSQTLNFTPKQSREIITNADVWINGGKMDSGNIGTVLCQDSFSGKLAYVLSNSLSIRKYLNARYCFKLKKGGKFIFNAALVKQGTSYASPVEFRLDEQAWTSVTPPKENTNSWGISNAISWIYLGKFNLQPGDHSIEFRFNKKSMAGTFSFMCDGIVGLRADTEHFQLDDLAMKGDAVPGKGLEFSFRSISNGWLKATLQLRKEIVTGKVFSATKGLNTVFLLLPKFMGGDCYSLIITPFAKPNDILATEKVSISEPEQVMIIDSIKKISFNKKNCQIVLDSPASTDLLVVGLGFVDQKLYTTEIFKIRKNMEKIDASLTVESIKVSTGRNTNWHFHLVPGTVASVKKNDFKISGYPVPLDKPMNYGIFIDSSGLAHPWFMNRDSQYVFDGKIYFPVGGMWIPDTLISSATDEESIYNNLKHDRKVLQDLMSMGINDIYLNLALRAPIWLRQYFIDILEKANIKYGYELCAAGKKRIPSFFITRDKSNNEAKWQGLLRGIYDEDGKLSVEIPQTYKVIGAILLPDIPNPTWCKFVQFTSGNDSRISCFDLEVAQSFKNTKKVYFKIDLQAKVGAKFILIPLIDAKMQHDNLWDPQERKGLKDRLEWVKDIKWGPNFRFLIDPIQGEAHMLNATENLRQYTSEINADFSCWLRNKYHSTDALQKAWGNAISDFDLASRLVPLRLGTSLFLADPEGGKVFSVPLKNSQAWIDYNNMIRKTYSSYQDDIFIYVKGLVNIPVISKCVGAHASEMNISKKYLGCDGIGFEVYGGMLASGARVAVAEACTHTVWKVGTEIGHLSCAGNGGVKFFKNYTDIRKKVDELAQLGISGFYFFGFDLKPVKVWENHNCHDFPKGLKWISKIKNDYIAGKGMQAQKKPYSYIYPGGFCWWRPITRFKAIYDYERNEIPMTVSIKNGEWGCSTDVIPTDVKRVVVNCEHPPFSIKHASVIGNLIKNNKKVIYLGMREDLGTIPELDIFFSSDMINFSDGSKAQVLHKLPGVSVLAEERGMAWAIRKKNLLIVSRAPVKKRGDENIDTGFTYLKSEWVK